MADIEKTAKEIESMGDRYVSTRPESLAAAFKNKLEAVAKTDVPGLPEIVKAVIGAVMVADKTLVEPYKLKELARKITIEHAKAVSELVKHFSSNGTVTDAELATALDQSTIRGEIAMYGYDTVRKALTEKIEYEKVSKNASINSSIDSFLATVVSAIINHARETIKKTLELYKKKLEGNQEEAASELIADDDKLESHEATSQVAERIRYSPEKHETILNDIKTKKLTYGVLALHHLVLKKISWTLTGLNKGFEQYKNYFDPAMVRKFLARYRSMSDDKLKMVTGQKLPITVTRIQAEKSKTRKFVDSIGNTWGKIDMNWRKMHAVNYNLLKSKNFDEFREHTSKLIKSDRRSAMIFGAGKTMLFAAGILATTLNLSLKVVNKAASFAFRTIKRLYTMAMFAIGGITNHLIVSPIVKLLQSRVGMFATGFIIGVVTTLLKTIFAPGSKWRELLDEKLDPIKKLIFGKIEEYKEKLADYAREKLGLPENAPLNFDTVMKALINKTDNAAAKREGTAKIGLQTVSILLKTIDFTINTASVVVKKIKETFQTMTNWFMSRYEARKQEKESEWQTEVDNQAGTEKKYTLNKEYSILDYLTDMQDGGFFSMIKSELYSWYENSWLSWLVTPITYLVQFASLFCVDSFKVIVENLDLIASTITRYFTSGLSFLGALPGIWGILGAMAGLAISAGWSMLTKDKEAVTVADEYQEMFGEGNSYYEKLDTLEKYASGEKSLYANNDKTKLIPVDLINEFNDELNKSIVDVNSTKELISATQSQLKNIDNRYDVIITPKLYDFLDSLYTRILHNVNNSSFFDPMMSNNVVLSNEEDKALKNFRKIMSDVRETKNEKISAGKFKKFLNSMATVNNWAAKQYAMYVGTTLDNELLLRTGISVWKKKKELLKSLELPAMPELDNIPVAPARIDELPANDKKPAQQSGQQQMQPVDVGPEIQDTSAGQTGFPANLGDQTATSATPPVQLPMPPPEQQEVGQKLDITTNNLVPEEKTSIEPKDSEETTTFISHTFTAIENMVAEVNKMLKNAAAEMNGCQDIEQFANDLALNRV